MCRVMEQVRGIQKNRQADLNRPALFKAITQATHHGSDTMLNRHGEGKQIGKIKHAMQFY